MKKTWLSLTGAFILTLAGMLWNYLSFKDRNWLALAYTMFGGEITVQFGFGLRMVHIYSMRPEGHDSIRLSFDVFSFVICLGILFLIIFLILSVIQKKKTG